MRIQTYNSYSGMIEVAVSTPRPLERASAHFVHGKIHLDYCARVRAAMREAKHITPTTRAYQAAQRLETYFPRFPVSTGNPLFSLRQLQPAGAPRNVDKDSMTENMAIRYAFTLDTTGAFLSADAVDAEAIERHLETAVRQLLETLEIPTVSIPNQATRLVPGDDDVISDEQTTISIMCELGPATARSGADVPQPV